MTLRLSVDEAVPGAQQPVLVWIEGRSEPLLATIAPRMPWTGEPAPIVWRLPGDIPADLRGVTHWRYLAPGEACSSAN